MKANLCCDVQVNCDSAVFPVMGACLPIASLSGCVERSKDVCPKFDGEN